jgi:hypothetical protein
VATPTQQMSDFLDEWAEFGAPVVASYGLPLSAMLACASVESAWGQGKIYLRTLCPFSLQKWPAITYPRTHKIEWITTVIQTSPKKTASAPFICSTDRADAVQQWCDWITHYGAADGPPGNQAKQGAGASAAAAGKRTTLLGYRNSPTEFARHLPLVGFGEGAKSGPIYAARLTNYAMLDYDQ